MTDTAGCLGKLSYPTRADADRAKRHLHEKRGYLKPGPGRADPALHTYHCRCGAFHLGRDRRSGGKDRTKTADHHAGSHQARKARYIDLTKET